MRRRWRWASLAVALAGGCGVSTDDFELPELSIDALSSEAQASPSRADVERSGSRGPGHEADETIEILEEPPVVRLRAPRVRWSGPAKPYTRDRADAGQVARPYWFNAPVFEAPHEGRRVVGLVRRNTELPVSHRVWGKGCEAGAWYQLVGGGYVCRSDGYAVSTTLDPLPEDIQTRRPGSESPIPYMYAKVRQGDPPLYWRLPTADELAAESDAPVKERSTGAHFAAIESLVPHAGRTFAKTVRGFFVDVEDLSFLEPSRMSGELLGGETTLPIAFVHEDFAPVHDPDTIEVIGYAEKYARGGVEDEVRDGGARMVRLSDGVVLPRASVRVAYRAERPDRIPSSAQWLAVDLDEQTLVAYQGDAPVMATLISSGKAGYEPGLGVFQVEKKYLSKTMQGPDDIAGTYRVEQVPWTMYYWGSLALHGAYWHDGFGKPRSHGCTNIPPVDARWVFQWAKPELRPGWHGAVRVDGPHVYVYRSGRASGNGSKAPNP